MAIANIPRSPAPAPKITSAPAGDKASLSIRTPAAPLPMKKPAMDLLSFSCARPGYFKQQCRVTLQQIGGEMKAVVAGLQKAGVPLDTGYHR